MSLDEFFRLLASFDWLWDYSQHPETRKLGQDKQTLIMGLIKEHGPEFNQLYDEFFNFVFCYGLAPRYPALAFWTEPIACPTCGFRKMESCDGQGWLEAIGPCADGSYITSRRCPRS